MKTIAFVDLHGSPTAYKKLKKKIKVIDLRWLSDINLPNLLKAIGTCAKVLIVDECRKRGCHGEGLIADMVSVTNKRLTIKLHAAKDSFIPLGEVATVTLPSKESIIKHALKLVNG